MGHQPPPPLGWQGDSLAQSHGWEGLQTRDVGPGEAGCRAAFRGAEGYASMACRMDISCYLRQMEEVWFPEELHVDVSDLLSPS